MKDLAGFLPIFGIFFATIFLTIAEIFILKYSKRVDSPKFIWFPISANVVGLIVMIIILIVAVILFAVGFITAFGAGFNEGEKYFYLMALALILMPILIFAVRTILFLLFKIGKFPIGLLYAFVTTTINLIVIIITAFVFLGIYENVFK